MFTDVDLLLLDQSSYFGRCVCSGLFYGRWFCDGGEEQLLFKTVLQDVSDNTIRNIFLRKRKSCCYSCPLETSLNFICNAPHTSQIHDFHFCCNFKWHEAITGIHFLQWLTSKSLFLKRHAHSKGYEYAKASHDQLRPGSLEFDTPVHTIGVAPDHMTPAPRASNDTDTRSIRPRHTDILSKSKRSKSHNPSVWNRNIRPSPVNYRNPSKPNWQRPDLKAKPIHFHHYNQWSRELDVLNKLTQQKGR